MPYIVDTETTGLKEPQPVEVAYIKLPENFNLLSTFSKFVHGEGISNFDKVDEELEIFLNTCEVHTERFRPSKAIEPTASKLHGIYMKDVLQCTPVEEMELPKFNYMIGHCISYDYRALNKPDTKLICTKDLANLAFEKELGTKKIANRKLVTLVGFLYPQEIDKVTTAAHTALGDCILSLVLLSYCVYKLDYVDSWEGLARLCSQPKDKNFDKYEKPATHMPFGKYKGISLAEVPVDYLTWLYKQDNLSKDLRSGIKETAASRGFWLYDLGD